jgi:competence protein ComGC
MIKKHQKKRFIKGFTLVEMSVGLLAASLIVVTIMKLFSSGMTGSQKGLSHLANMEAANILMSQLEYDLTRAREITDPEVGGKSASARWVMISDKAEEAVITYQIIDKCVKRTLVEGTKNQDYTYCKGLHTDITFERVKFVDDKTKIEKEGMWINLKVSAPKKGVGELEEFSLKRLIMGKNII